jgi:hypothetical protein
MNCLNPSRRIACREKGKDDVGRHKKELTIPFLSEISSPSVMAAFIVVSYWLRWWGQSRRTKLIGLTKMWPGISSHVDHHLPAERVLFVMKSLETRFAEWFCCGQLRGAFCGTFIWRWSVSVCLRKGRGTLGNTLFGDGGENLRLESGGLWRLSMASDGLNGELLNILHALRHEG